MIDYHIGSEIRFELKRQGLKTSDLAVMINCSNSNIYNIMARPSVDINLLVRISKALKKNFLLEYANAMNL